MGAIKDLVSRIVDQESRKGNAQDALKELQERLEAERDEAGNQGDNEKRRSLNNEVEYVKGYRESAGPAMADITNFRDRHGRKWRPR